MALNKRDRDRLRAHCGELHHDDGIDPRDFFGSDRAKKQDNRKAKQLCRQVAETLALVLSGETSDESLENLRVVSVVPAPNSSRLLVTLAVDSRSGDFDREEIENRLAHHRGRLRCQIAAAITRKKAPNLAFNVIDFAAVQESDQ